MSFSAAGFIRVIRPWLSVAMTASPMESRVTFKLLSLDIRFRLDSFRFSTKRIISPASSAPMMPRADKTPIIRRQLITLLTLLACEVSDTILAAAFKSLLRPVRVLKYSMMLFSWSTSRVSLLPSDSMTGPIPGSLPTRIFMYCRRALTCM